MQPESLEEIKLLSNLETDQHKLLQIVLFGQPELDELLALPKLRQVRDRVVHRFELQPLNKSEAAAYIEHRLRRAGWQGGALFETRALSQLIDASGGRIRAIHLLADKALLAAFAQGARQVGPEHVRLAISEVLGRTPSIKPKSRPAAPHHRPTWVWPALGVLVAMGLVGAAGYGLGQRSVTSAAPVVMAAAPAVAAQSTPVAMVTPVATPAASTPHAMASRPAPAAVPASAPAVAPSQAIARAPAIVPIIPPSLDLQARYAALPPQLRDAVLRTRAVFDDPTQEFWVVQIGVANDVAGALSLMQMARQAGAEIWLQDRVYPGQAAGGALNVLAVYAGRYPDRSSAVQNLQKWPDSLKPYKPLPRSLLRLRTEAYPERVPS
jgi:hypothetical protein